MTAGGPKRTPVAVALAMAAHGLRVAPTPTPEQVRRSLARVANRTANAEDERVVEWEINRSEREALSALRAS